MFKTVEEIRKHFVNDGWGKDTSFRELTIDEAKKTGLSFTIDGLTKGKRYFVMNICNNLYDENGKLLCFGNIKINN